MEEYERIDTVAFSIEPGDYLIIDGAHRVEWAAFDEKNVAVFLEGMRMPLKYAWDDPVTLMTEV